jgi:hypothetical protein
MIVNKDLEKMRNEEMAVGHTIPSSVGTARGSGLDGWGLTPRGGFFSFPKHRDRLWGPPSLLSNGYWGALPPEADHSHLMLCQEWWSYTSTPP